MAREGGPPSERASARVKEALGYADASLLGGPVKPGRDNVGDVRNKLRATFRDSLGDKS
jgi:hypothetical protein